MPYPSSPYPCIEFHMHDQNHLLKRYYTDLYNKWGGGKMGMAGIKPF